MNNDAVLSVMSVRGFSPWIFVDSDWALFTGEETTIECQTEAVTANGWASSILTRFGFKECPKAGICIASIPTSPQGLRNQNNAARSRGEFTPNQVSITPIVQ